MRIFYRIALFLSCIGSLQAQNGVDSSELKVGHELFSKANLIYNVDQDSAIYLIQKANKHYKKSKSWPTYVSSLNTLVAVYYHKNDYDLYQEYSQRAVEEADKYLSSNDPQYALALNNQIDYFAALGNFEKAIEGLKKSLAIYESSEVNSLALATVYHNMGDMLSKQGDFSEALEFLNRAFNLRKDTLTKAIDLKLEKLEPNPIPQLRHLLSSTESMIAWTYYLNGQVDKSLLNFESSLKSLKSISGYNSAATNIDLISMLQSIAFIEIENKNYNNAYRYLKEALEYQKDDSAFRRPRSYELIGQVFMGLGKFDQAKIHLEKALQLSQTSNTASNLPDYARKFVSMAKVYEKEENIEEALRFYQNALHTLAPTFKDSNFLQNPNADQLFSKLDALDVLNGKGKLAWKMFEQTNDIEAATISCNAFKKATEIIKSIRQGVLTREAKNKLAEENISLYEGAIKSALEIARHNQDDQFLLEGLFFAESNKSLSLLESMNEQAALGLIEISDSLLQLERNIRLEITFYQRLLMNSSKDHSLEKEVSNKYEDEIFKLRQRLNDLKLQFEKRYPSYYELKYAKEDRSLKSYQEMLKNEQTGLIEYFFGEENIFGFVLTGSGTVKVFEVNGRDEIILAIEKLKAVIEAPPAEDQVLNNYQQFTIQAQFLFEKLLAPALNQLPADIHRLKIVPDFKLNDLPFELLLMEKPKENKAYFDTQNLEYVFEKYAISYEYSATLMLKNQHRVQSSFDGDFIGFAPTFKKATAQNYTRSCEQGDLYNLECSEVEVENINTFFNGAIFHGQDASKSVFEKEAPNYRIVHFATHACIDEANPLFNKIFLTDDFLSNADIYNLKLNSELVVLSACNTGSGKLLKGEGVMSLARGFVQAGCRSTITTRWAVDDCATSNIMQYFYKKLQEGKTKDIALQEAKLDHLANADNALKHPYYWSTFIQSGKTTQLAFSSSSYLMYFFLSMLFITLIWLFIRMKK